MPTLEEVKAYLKIDYDDDDALLRALIRAADEYIRGAVGEYDVKSEQAKLIALQYIKEQYINREYSAKAAPNVSRMFRSVILQLQTERGTKE